MSFPNNHTYKVANGISTISRIDRRAAARKTYACAAGTPYTTDDQVHCGKSRHLMISTHHESVVLIGKLGA
ncbi:hypothetical protein BJ322DRAFT_1104204 [Thelephora terrestris]|uniref:Uncharacterized protein n=1 Tax=Thelephora terrestris TaxID=56493 RepID=A0A9P6HM14_9AGAM|nr:hypothetical protein BJ322DRAFT_1104204 [Thelephora terrestris]